MHRPIPRDRRGFRPGAAILAAAAVLTAAAPAAPDSVRLEYRLQPGAVYDQAVDMTMSLSMEMAGLPEDQAAMAGLLSQDMTQEMLMTMAMELGALEADGTMAVEMRIEDLQAAVVVAGQRMASPAAVTPGTTILAGRITPAGRMVSMETEGLHGAPSELVDRLLQFMPTIPDVDLKVGESFEVPLTMAVPLPGTDLRMEGKAVYTLQRVEGARAVFELVQDFAMGTGGEQGKEIGGMNMKMRGGGSGTAVFDLTEGIFSEILFDMELEADMEADPAAMRASGEGAPPAGAVSMKMKAGGPVKVTITRRGS